MFTLQLGRPSVASTIGGLLIVLGALLNPTAAHAAEPDGCADMTVPEENHASIRLRVDQPVSRTQVAVDERGKINVSGILHKQATLVDVAVRPVTVSNIPVGPPPSGVAAWASGWTTSLRPPHLGESRLCARAARDPKRSARILVSFTAVDLIPPSAVPNLAVTNITPTSARVSWEEATDNYGLAGYAITIDGGAAQRTTVGTRSYAITGLSPSTHHTVSVVAIDLAGNTSPTPATTSFTTAAAPPPTDSNLSFAPEEGAATAFWHPSLPGDAIYRAYLEGELLEEFPPERYCHDANGHPVSPCMAQHVIKFPIRTLEDNTPYTFWLEALHADRTRSRTLTGSFTTTIGPALVQPETTQLIASESSRCAGMGGKLYVPPSGRAGVPIPAGSTQVFEGCYTVQNHSCVDAFLPPSGTKLLKCADDLTRLLSTVAPAGRGPVISSLNDALNEPGTPAFGQSVQFEVGTLFQPITWCIHEEACVFVVVNAPRALELVSLAQNGGPALASASPVVVVVGGIAVGFAIGAILDIIFARELHMEWVPYPIEYNTNFETFNNWGLGQGIWYGNLQIYAEVVKTTTQAASRHNVPFVWDRDQSIRLKWLIGAACAIQRGVQSSVGACSNDVTVYVPGAANYKLKPMPETGAHIIGAMGDGFPQLEARRQWYFPARSVRGQAARNAGFSRGWFDTRAFKPNDCDPRPLGRPVCDEFPFWSTNQAVNLSGTIASLKPVPLSEAAPQGNDIAQFYRQCKVKNSDRFIVLPLKPWVAANGPSFGFKVTPGGTSLCLVPKP
jgi:hypothetical protein